jgi:hypothetical protein
MNILIENFRRLRRKIPILPVDIKSYFIFKKSYGTNFHRRIYFYHIRKCGGTSINYSFCSMCGNPKETYDGLSENLRIIKNNIIIIAQNKALIERGNYLYAFSHIPKHELMLPRDTFTFTSVRNLLDRLLSYYKMLRYYKENNIYNRYLKKEINWIGNNFEDFLRNLPKKELLRQVYMFSKNLNLNEAIEKYLSVLL